VCRNLDSFDHLISAGEQRGPDNAIYLSAESASPEEI
jgi:hypothetical protein